MKVFLSKVIGTALGSKNRPNSYISNIHPEWTEQKIYEKIGIKNRVQCDESESSLDLAIKAYVDLRSNLPLEVDYLIYVSNSSQLQAPGDGHRFAVEAKLGGNVGILDVNLGCSGYTHALSLAKALIVGRIAQRILIVTADQYTKYIDDSDKSNLTLFGDAATCSLVSSESFSDSWLVGKTNHGNDVSTADALTIRDSELYMDGPAVFQFAARTVVPFILSNINNRDDFTFVLHQSNKTMLDFMRRKLNVPAEKLPIMMENTGNTVSSSIPLVLSNLFSSQERLFLCGFGIGSSFSSVELN